jgi:type I restriction enzyme R subunit
MTKIGQSERQTQNRVIKLFQEELGYRYLGDWQYRAGNSNIEEEVLTAYLERQGYSDIEISKAIFEFKSVANDFSDNLYNTNKNVYEKLRYGVTVKASISKNSTTVHLIDWNNWQKNDFAIAEEVTIKGNQTKRPDIVIYVNGIALGVLELKSGRVDIADGIRQNITNQQDGFIQSFFATAQFVFAGNDTQGLRYGTIDTSEKWYLNWKENEADNSRLLLDKYLLKLCDKERFLEIIHDFILFDGGVKKLPRVHQYFGVKAAQKFINRYEGGIIWHTQGSGKSITMVVLAKWILENKPNARVVLLTDRTELDKQIEGVFQSVGETIHKASSGQDLMYQLKQPTKRLICSLVHKFGKKDVANFNAFIKDLEANPIDIAGELFVFVDECHRTQGGRLHKTMKTMLPNAVFIGFTGTPLLKSDKQTSLEIFGKYIHTYKFNQGVEDGIILDLVYEARDIDQHLTSQKRIDEWFDAKTKGLNDYQKSELKKKWGTMQNVLSSRSRMGRIVSDIIFDFSVKPRLSDSKGNAMLVAHSIYEACRYYELFQNSSTGFKGKCAVITSYNPQSKDTSKEDTGANTETQKQFIYNLYADILKGVPQETNKTKTETYEDKAKAKFKDEPANMKLLIVVSKLLTGFDVPTCTYLYIDKNMQDHGLFQAICRVNRLDSEDKLFGYIVDYKDLFKKVEDAISVYTSELDNDGSGTSEILLKDRLKIGQERLDDALEGIALLCELVKPPKETIDYIHYFCGNTEIAEELKAHEVQRTALYKKTVALIRAYANIKDELSEAGYSENAIRNLEKELNFYVNLRDEIKKASGEEIDLKSYEADMRHLIDTYIQADEPELISPFGELTLIDIIVNSGIADAIGTLPKGIKKNQGAIAETIENNVRRKIIKEHLINPAYFEKMSKLLDEIIKERKAGAVTYEEYLIKVAEVAKQTNAGRNSDTPKTLNTQGLRALYDNLGNNEQLALKIDAEVKAAKGEDWRGHQAKERNIQQVIYDALMAYETGSENIGNITEPLAGYGVMEKVGKIFDIIKAQSEY